MLVGAGCVLLALLLVSCDEDEPATFDDLGLEAGGVSSFYLEARVSVDSSAMEPDGSPRALSSQPLVTEVRWWQQDQRHYRHEFDQPESLIQWPPQLSVADGDEVTWYDPENGSYSRFDLPDDAAGFGGYPSFSGFFGPLPAANIDQFVDLWGQNVERVERVGTDEVEGRTVEVVEYGPTWTTSGESGSAAGSPTTRTEDSGGVGRLYIDEAIGFIVRHEVDGEDGQQSFTVDVTLLDLDPEFGDDLFSAELPDEAVLEEQNSDCSSSGSSGTGFTFAPEALTFGYVPDGWTEAGSGGRSDIACNFVEEWSSVERDEGELIAITQRPVPPTGVPPLRDDATPYDLDGLEAYRFSEGDVERLLWVQEGIIVLIESNASPFDELVRIAEAAG